MEEKKMKLPAKNEGIHPNIIILNAGGLFFQTTR